jgi:hypothetical protein
MNTIAGTSNLPPIEIPKDSPFVQDWMREAVHRLNMIVGAIAAPQAVTAGVGASVFAFSGTNAILILPASGLTQDIVLPKITTLGAQGMLNVRNGFVVGYHAPS